MKSKTEFSEVKTRFLVRYAPTVIDTSMIVAYNNKEYDINYVNEYGDKKEYIEIWCTLKELE